MKLKEILKVCLFFCTSLAIIAAIYFGIDKVKNAAVFTVSSVEVKGVINSDRDKLSELGKKVIGLNIFDHSIDSIAVSDDPWIQKLTAQRVLPNSINLVVFEEKPLFFYKNSNRCYIFTGAGKNLSSPCEGVKIESETVLEGKLAEDFAYILHNNPVLYNADIKLKKINFNAVIDGQLFICPYDSKLFAENYEIYSHSLKKRYKRVDYVDLTISKRIFVKGDRNATRKG